MRAKKGRSSALPRRRTAAAAGGAARSAAGFVTIGPRWRRGLRAGGAWKTGTPTLRRFAPEASQREKEDGGRVPEKVLERQGGFAEGAVAYAVGVIGSLAAGRRERGSGGIRLAKGTPNAFV